MNRKKLIQDLEYLEDKLIEKTKPYYVDTPVNRRMMAQNEILYDILTYILKKEQKSDD